MTITLYGCDYMHACHLLPNNACELSYLVPNVYIGLSKATAEESSGRGICYCKVSRDINQVKEGK